VTGIIYQNSSSLHLSAAISSNGYAICEYKVVNIKPLYSLTLFYILCCAYAMPVIQIIPQ